MTVQAKVNLIETYYGSVPTTPNGHVVSEDAEKVRKHHYADKENYRKHKLTANEKTELKNAVKKTPKRFLFGQIIKIA